MRPIAQQQSALITPLNAVLGRESHVRIIRALTLAQAPLSRAELQREARLNANTVPRAVQALVDLEVLEPVGSSPRAVVRLRDQSRLVRALKELFEEEARRFTDLVSWLRNEVGMLDPKPASAWIEGPLATGTDTIFEAIGVGLLDLGQDTTIWSEALRPRLLHTQRQFDVSLDLRIRTRADLLTMTRNQLAQLEHVIPLVGPRPLDVLGLASESKRTVPPEHREHDAEALRTGRALALVLRSNRSLVERALRWLDAQIPTAEPAQRRTLQEWHDILSSYSLPRLRALLESSTERATRLRQSNPFLPVLLDSEVRTVKENREGK